MEQKASVWQIGFKFGLITSIVLIIFSLILNVTELSFDPNIGGSLQYLSYLFLIIGMIFAHKAYKERNDGFMKYGTGLGLGTIVALLSGVLGAVFFFVYVSYVDTEYIAKALELGRLQMEKKGLDDDVVDQAIEMQAKFMTPTVMSGMAAVFTLIGGFILSLLVTIFTKKNRPDFE
ncbi:DUF4199 domain-containing protein [Xanthovirga aplysinae]|uniref:DUF4199 domain-containing protein n=1 Tax=Xanthovirga aplysinae TaxID=2529853 RepID=UPI0012BCCA19|nr:DUF4199 domain-containing protein [Xanthovirga aplysinae]MTI32537.1 DUF4199 domain-containing protein [Xanthovirga aplysinae]